MRTCDRCREGSSWKHRGEQIRAVRKASTTAARKHVLDHYGPQCACCGEDNPGFLTIDHVLNDGCLEKRHLRSGLTYYRKIIKEGFPPRYQVLCMNCNWGKSKNNGICPHSSKPASLHLPKIS